MLDPTGVDFVPTARHDTYAAIDPAKANLYGKVVVITGASKGIGHSIAVALAQAGVSALVLIARSDMSAVKVACEAAQRPGQSLRVLTISASVSDTHQVVEAAQKVREELGRVDVLVNNAGYMEKYGLIAEQDPSEWWKVWSVNLQGTYEVTRAFLPLLTECGGDKTIVNMTSIGGHFQGPRYSAYQVSKLALMRFTELIMAEYTEQGVLAYSVHPGSIATDMAATMPEELMGVLVDSPEVAAHTIVWLVKERREWLGGRYVSCQWDVDELSAKKEEIITGDKLKVRMVV
ncbi:NAD(P)-binding protein [Wolfiporia cocos MD-104 SS10]|uniref:NAD(P)-binding protein n=1 Tax=Wolfiporia cocos (strain MD-104) TaxID=742152 RepID=A0A2H3IXA7_WOLCO|nr:NAD(P)-binding protein [Wolfiporia cocos MD-104 SS10]